MKKRVSIIGSGIGGLASAIRMAARGYEVAVFEQAPMAGGKISELKVNGFRFDTGPSLLTMPWLIDELFELAGEAPGKHFRYNLTRATCKYFWEDGTIINAWNDPLLFAGEAALATGVDQQKIFTALDKSKELYDIAGDLFLFNSLHKPGNFKKKHFLKALLNIGKLDAFTTMHKRNHKTFGNKHLTQLFDRYATYNGSNPYASPATMNIIAHLEHNTGAYFPEKGMYSIVESLVKMATVMGVEFHYNSPVNELILQGDTVRGLKVNGESHLSDFVINNTDVENFYRHILREPLPARQQKAGRSSSALIFYWAMNRYFPALELHNILFSDNYPGEFDHLFNKKTIIDDPTIYIFISSKNNAADAPPDMENWYVMVNAPENIGQDWDSMRLEVRSKIIEKINRMLKVNIEDHIISETHEDPRGIEKRTGSYNGSLYGINSNGMLSAFNRHPNFTRRYQNLYFTGGSVHPGGGIPLCLASASIVDKEIQERTR